MRKLLFAVIFVFSGILTFAQQDQKAKSILENVTKTTQSFKTIRADFNYVMDNKSESIHEENKGEIIMSGDKYQLKMPQLGLEVYNNGKNVWTYMKDANEVSIASASDGSQEMMNPSKLFTIYQHGFTYKFVEESMLDGQPAYVIDLFPESSNETIEYSKIRIYVDKQKMLIKKAEMTGKEGNNYIIRINDMKTDVPVDDKLFVFDAGKYPGVETVDLR